jgi:hypothetical protein
VRDPDSKAQEEIIPLAGVDGSSDDSEKQSANGMQTVHMALSSDGYKSFLHSEQTYLVLRQILQD